jgi:hypothetical protein
VVAGQELIIPIKADQFNEVHGMQWTASFKDLEILEIQGKALEIKTDQTAILQPNTMTLSWSADKAQTILPGVEVMTIKVRALKSGDLVGKLQINSTITHAEAYTGQGFEIGDVHLELRNGKTNHLQLGQNEPNPWQNETKISFNMPSKGQATLTVTDLSGKLILNRKIQAEAGENTLKLSRSDIMGASGLLIYKIDFEQNTVQKKMMIME